MPVYEYECLGCGKHIEALQKISDDPLKKCGSCGGVLNRLISLTSFSLKGGGWYKDGYSKKPNSTEKEKTATPVPSKSKAEKKDATNKAS